MFFNPKGNVLGAASERLVVAGLEYSEFPAHRCSRIPNGSLRLFE